MERMCWRHFATMRSCCQQWLIWHHNWWIVSSCSAGRAQDTLNRAMPTGEMKSMLEHCALFNAKDVSQDNITIVSHYNKCDKNNNNDAIECFMNSLEDTPRKSPRVKAPEHTRFARVTQGSHACCSSCGASILWGVPRGSPGLGE